MSAPITPPPQQPVDEIAAQIEALSSGMEKLLSGRLNKKAILVLLRETSGLGMRDIEKVLEAARSLRTHFLKKEPPR